ncbi:MAG: hypothetical protein D6767_09995 [Candidatus Hydrogenedentota bacterium]|nr:MAG: hypothetical protein D6767_09995 [Candidatus Hydrogenedentota bacterium]
MVGISMPAFAGFLMGFQFPAIHNIGKSAKGWYRTPASSTNVEIDYQETMFYLGGGLMFEVGMNPGHAGMRITPTLYKGSTEVNSSNFTVHTYDLLGFSNEQAQKLASNKPNKVIIKESAIGTGLVFKYNAPVKFKASKPFFFFIQKILQTTNPWIGIGPMMITFSRKVQAGEGDSAEYAAFTYTDFYFLIGGGFNVELHHTIEKIPANIIISLEFLYTLNLTPDNDLTTNDDTIQYDQTGFIFNLGFGYRI